MIVAFVHPKGGVGKSLIAFNTAVYLTRNKHNVEIIDLDGQKTISSINKLRISEGLNSLKINQFNSIETLAQYIDSNFDKLILIDTGGFDSKFNHVVLAVADIIITPVSTAPVEIMRLINFNEILENLSRDPQINRDIKTFILLNKIHPNVKNVDEIKEVINEYKHFECLDPIIRMRSKIENSVSSGHGIFDKSYEAKMKSEKDKEAYKAAHQDLAPFFKTLEKIIKERS